MRLLTVEVEAAIAKVNDDARAKSQVASALLLMGRMIISFRASAR
jgi:hypothetical protein